MCRYDEVYVFERSLGCFKTIFLQTVGGVIYAKCEVIIHAQAWHGDL